MPSTNAKRIANLEKLATYLEQLPEDYDKFHMSYYIRNNTEDERTLDYLRNNGGIHKCGTAGCALGHGPAAGILFSDSEIAVSRSDANWPRYVTRFVDGEFSRNYHWMFGPSWSRVDNTPQGAAARIRYFLDNGVPEQFDQVLYSAYEPDELEYINWPDLYAEYHIENKENT